MTSYLLKPLKLGDEKYMMSWVNDPEVMKNFPQFKKKHTIQEERAWIQKMLKSDEDRIFLIFRESDNKYLGNIGLHKIYKPAKTARLGLVITERGQGHGQHAIEFMLKLAFENEGFHKIWMIHFEENKKMDHITSKIGFKQEGLLIQEYVDQQGVYHNMVRKYMLKSDYLKNQTPR